MLVVRERGRTTAATITGPLDAPTMATNNGGVNTGLINLERELVCFICTEILYQPLTVIDCLHTFCGAHLKEWFVHQYRRAKSTRADPASNPYTCPTCRAPVQDVRPNAMVNTYLDMLLSANPTHARSKEDKEEMSAMYTPGENILPKLDSGRRRERRTRRDEEEIRERRMLEEATQRSLQDVHGPPAQSQESLQVPPRQTQSSRSRDRERDARRDRRREQERERRRNRATEPESGAAQESVENEEPDVAVSTVVPPTTSPRHPEAVENRQRQQTVAHQPSLVSLISSSEGSMGTGTSDTLDGARVMQEIMAAQPAFLEGIDIDSLTEAEEDILAQRIAEFYRQMQRTNSQQRSLTEANVEAPNLDSQIQPSPPPPPLASTASASETRSQSRQQRAETSADHRTDDAVDQRPRSARTFPPEGDNNLLSPQVIVTHRRRSSNQSQSQISTGSRSRQSSPPSKSFGGRSVSATNVITNPHISKEVVIPNREQQSQSTIAPEATLLPEARPQTSVVQQQQQTSDTATVAVSSPKSSVSGPATEEAKQSRSTVTRAPAHIQYDEPSVSCYRCHRADIQYEVYKHCSQCDLDLCRRCYRTGRGCKHWFGFGHSAMPKFEAVTSDRRDTEAVELPHVLAAKSMRRPEASLILTSKLAKDGHTLLPLTSRSNPQDRAQEGHFCDRCGVFADSCFWMCDYCNEGEWGFCRDCVNTHHCCTHPLLPIAHRSTVPALQSQHSKPDPISTGSYLTPSELHNASLRLSPATSQPSTATTVVSTSAGPQPGYVNLNMTTKCDICHQPIPPVQMRYHCPFHLSPTASNAEATGDYDICTPCYHDLVKSNRIKRDDGPVGWRKCPLNHRMIITAFEPDSEGALRRVVVNDLVGGWKMKERDMNAWMVAIIQRRDQQSYVESPTSPVSNPLEISTEGPATWTWREDQNSARRSTRARTLTLSPGGTANISTSTISNTPASPTTSSYPKNKFPPDSGFGARGNAWWSYYPDEGEDGKGELMFPRGAEVREITDINGDWWEGVYAGDGGVAPKGYVQW